MKKIFILTTLIILTSCSSFINKNRSYSLAAQDILEEVLQEGTDEQKAQANELISKL